MFEILFVSSYYKNYFFIIYFEKSRENVIFCFYCEMLFEDMTLKYTKSKIKIDKNIF